MKTRKFFIIILPILAVITLAAFSCDKKNKPESTNLKGTTWKLEGIVNEKTGFMQVLEPVNCDVCYSFTFDSDTHGTGKTTSNILQVYLNTLPYLGIATFVCEIADGNLLTDVLSLINRYEYSISNSELKFFYQKENVNYYLLFKNYSDEKQL